MIATYKNTPEPQIDAGGYGFSSLGSKAGDNGYGHMLDLLSNELECYGPIQSKAELGTLSGFQIQQECQQAQVVEHYTMCTNEDLRSIMFNINYQHHWVPQTTNYMIQGAKIISNATFIHNQISAINGCINKSDYLQIRSHP
jgi:hypothetical protein